MISKYIISLYAIVSKVTNLDIFGNRYAQILLIFSHLLSINMSLIIKKSLLSAYASHHFILVKKIQCAVTKIIHIISEIILNRNSFMQ